MAAELYLAPMVRIGTTPTRLLALKYGAKLVYSPELVDKRLVKCSRISSENHVDFIADGKLVLKIHNSEKTKLIVQIGSSSPEICLKAAKIVENDVAGIDLNCGCPKPFSTSGGMGSRLLENQSVLIAILENLVKNLSVPVSCKIRLLDEKDGKSSTERTIDLLQKIEKTGVSSIAVHCRFTRERPREPGHWDVFDKLQAAISVPLIANGDLYNMQDITRLNASTGKSISRFMIARGAQMNPSIFSENPLPPKLIMQEYLALAMKLGIAYSNAKYVLLHMDYIPTEQTKFRQLLIRSKNYRDVWYFKLTNVIYLMLITLQILKNLKS